MAQEAISSNRRIAKNTVMLYIRMLLSMAVSLYTSRVVLNTLGVEDYGIYGVVGGVVAMFSFLNSAMGGATSRFLTYEMGRGDTQRLRDTFSSALLIHIGIALVILLLAETIGLWFLVHKLVIPEERMFAAHVVYQLSIVSTMVGITQVPYNATIIAHEKMDIYAYVELLNVSLKLLIVFLLPILGNDKLIVYGILVFAVSVLIAMIYRWYCFKRYQEVHFHFLFDKSIIYPMLSFSGWDLLGHLGFTLRIQGTNILLNIFFGPIVNAANSLATTVQNVFLSFTSNVTMAVRPAVIKSYAQDDLPHFYNLIRETSRLSYFIMFIIVIPIIVHSNLILRLWLGSIPDYADNFMKLCLLINCISAYSSVIYIGIHACGAVKQSGLIRTVANFMILIIGYVFFIFNSIPETMYVLILASQFIILISDLFILFRSVKQTLATKYFLADLIEGVIGGAIVYLTLDLFFDTYSIFTLILSLIISSIVFMLITLLSLTDIEKKVLKNVTSFSKIKA